MNGQTTTSNSNDKEQPAEVAFNQLVHELTHNLTDHNFFGYTDAAKKGPCPAAYFTPNSSPNHQV